MLQSPWCVPSVRWLVPVIDVWLESTVPEKDRMYSRSPWSSHVVPASEILPVSQSI